MKKKLITRCLFGVPAGISISCLITVFISLVAGQGSYYPVVPQLIDFCGNEINAVVLQTLCSMLYGAAWAGSSVLWEMEDWSLLRMTATHFVITSLITFPAAWFMWWMPHSLIGAVSYFGIFLVIYLVIWITQFMAIKNKITQMNEQLNR